MIQPTLHFYDFGEGVKAFSSTRKGGCSEGNYAEFNINHYCGDSEDAIQINRTSLCQYLDISTERLIMPHQVHQTEIVAIDEAFLRLSADEQKARLEGVDALMTGVAGVCIGVSTADCIPVLVYDKVQRVSCAIHAGWRGTVARIVQKTIKQMQPQSPDDIHAIIGPGISLEWFEVGDEVYETFKTAGFPMERIARRSPSKALPLKGTGESWHIDLWDANRWLLEQMGVEDIFVEGTCTRSSMDFYSARRETINTGRNYNGIYINE